MFSSYLQTGNSTFWKNIQQINSIPFNIFYNDKHVSTKQHQLKFVLLETRPRILHLWHSSQQWQPFLGAFIRGSARASFTSPRKSQSWRSLRAAWWLRSHTRLWWRAFHTSFHFVYFPFNEASSSAAYPLLSATAQSPTRPRLAEIKSSCPNWSQKFLSLFFPALHVLCKWVYFLRSSRLYVSAWFF